MSAPVYVGAGQWRASAVDARAQGLYRLEPESGAWRALERGLPGDVEVRFIALKPGAPETVFVGTQDGPYRSSDGGENWTELPLPDDATDEEQVVWSILIHPGDPDTILVGTQGRGLFRSTDGGDSWRRLAIETPEGAVHMSFPMRVIRLAMDPSDPALIYVAFEVGGLARSTDGGLSWESCNATLLELAEQAHLKSQIVSDTDAEGMMDSHAIATSPAHPGHLWLANRMGLFQSTDRGQSFTELGIARHSPLTYARDVQVSAHDPETVYAALSVAAASDEGALYRSGDFGRTWSRFDHGVSIDSTLMIIAQSRASAERVYCAARRGQVIGTEDGGLSWRNFDMPEGVEGVYALACV